MDSCSACDGEGRQGRREMNEVSGSSAYKRPFGSGATSKPKSRLEMCAGVREAVGFSSLAVAQSQECAAVLHHNSAFQAAPPDRGSIFGLNKQWNLQHSLHIQRPSDNTEVASEECCKELHPYFLYEAQRRFKRVLTDPRAAFLCFPLL